MRDLEKKKTVSIHLYVLFSLLSLSLVVGIYIGKGMRTIEEVHGPKDIFFRGKESEFKFTHPLDAGESSSSRGPGSELKPFRYKVTALIEERLKKRDAYAVSVYFRDLNNGNWFGINENEKFSQASLLKLPLMIAFFKWAEDNPLLLSKRIPYAATPEISAAQDPERPGKSRKVLEPGKSYTINNLIYRMIAYGDQSAFTLLMTQMPPERLHKVYKDLYVDYEPAKSDDDLSLSAYAAFFRVLYNASYLSREMSEKALDYLSHESFTEGMLSAVPPDIEIARKFGERTVVISDDEEETELRQLHEFGIIYYPNRPLLIGIMTRGNDHKKLGNVIRDITRLIYDEVDRQSMLH